MNNNSWLYLIIGLVILYMLWNRQESFEVSQSNQISQNDAEVLINLSRQVRNKSQDFLDNKVSAQDHVNYLQRMQENAAPIMQKYPESVLEEFLNTTILPNTPDYNTVMTHTMTKLSQG